MLKPIYKNLNIIEILIALLLIYSSCVVAIIAIIHVFHLFGCALYAAIIGYGVCSYLEHKKKRKIKTK